MGEFIIEDEILKGYAENGQCVNYPYEKLIIPKGVKRVAGDKTEIDMERRFFDTPKPFKDIFYQSFMFNKNIKEVVIPDGVEIVGAKAFEWSDNIKTIHIPKTLKKFEINSLNGLKIEDVYYDGKLTDFINIKFDESRQDFHYVHCSDCVMDLSKEFYLDEYTTNLTKKEWEELTKPENVWMYRRIMVVHCSDTDILNEKEKQ